MEQAPPIKFIFRPSSLMSIVSWAWRVFSLESHRLAGWDFTECLDYFRVTSCHTHHSSAFPELLFCLLQASWPVLHVGVWHKSIPALLCVFFFFCEIPLYFLYGYCLCLWEVFRVFVMSILQRKRNGGRQTDLCYKQNQSDIRSNEFPLCLLGFLRKQLHCS